MIQQNELWVSIWHSRQSRNFQMVLAQGRHTQRDRHERVTSDQDIWGSLKQEYHNSEGGPGSERPAFSKYHTQYLDLFWGVALLSRAQQGCIKYFCLIFVVGVNMQAAQQPSGGLALEHLVQTSASGTCRISGLPGRHLDTTVMGDSTPIYKHHVGRQTALPSQHSSRALPWTNWKGVLTSKLLSSHSPTQQHQRSSTQGARLALCPSG